jgi:hypothetical protein
MLIASPIIYDGDTDDIFVLVSKIKAALITQRSVLNSGAIRILLRIMIKSRLIDPARFKNFIFFKRSDSKLFYRL